MKILYLTILDVLKNDLYKSLVETLIENNHEVTIVMPTEKKTKIKKEKNIKVLEVEIKDLYSKNMVLKAKANLLLESKYKKQISKLKDDYDLVIYSTPPITFAGVVEFCKKKFECKSYLMLKDIFPQNAVDIEMFKKGSIPYRIFRKKEIKLYKLSDYIGCMSKGNMEYLLENEKWIDKDKVELFPNTIKIKEKQQQNNKRDLSKYGIKESDLVFIFGGNLGKPQGIKFLLRAIEKVQFNKEVKFIIVGNGTEAEVVEKKSEEINNLTFIRRLEKEEYDLLVNQCDVGILSLDYRFTIPNYPSRTLAYMDNEMPILACTDKITDIKTLVESEAKCGKWCYSDNEEDFEKTIDWFMNNKDKLKELGKNGRQYLEENFNVKKSVEILEEHFCK